jgi:beta-glucosidase
MIKNRKLEFRYLVVLFILILKIGVILELSAQNSDPMDERVVELIGKMTLQEKISQLGNQAPAISRLGIKSYNYWVEGLHGVARHGLATSFPQPLGMSATWDTLLIHQIAKVISDEARIKSKLEGIDLTYWCPVVNMARDPRWGRTEEGFGEDVYLTSRLAVNYIKGMQGDDPKYLKTIATPKHFACNNIEANRYGISSSVDERSLREYYLPAFKASIMEGKALSIMSAYNAVNGVPSPANRTLLHHILREEWGFDGYVVSDCDAIFNVSNNHQYTPTLSEASALSILNGNDLNCGSTVQDYLMDAMNKGLIKESDIDLALFRVFKARFLLGEFDPASEVPFNAIPTSLLDCEEHRQLALTAARKSIVLLKNSNSALPLKTDEINSIAIIGPNANTVQLGDYSGAPSVSISPVSGIAKSFGITIGLDRVEAENFANAHSSIQLEGSSEGTSNIGYIRNGYTASYAQVDFGTGKNRMEFRVACGGTGGTIEVRLDNPTGTLVGNIPVVSTGGWQDWVSVNMDIVSIEGKHDVYLTFKGGSGYLYNINWFKFYNATDEHIITQDYGIVTNESGSKTIKYAYGCPVNESKIQKDFDQAVEYARTSDVAILVMGTNMETGGESHDISTLNLPGDQQQLVEAVFAVNPKTILVLVTAFPMSVNFAQENIPAILSSWFNGQAQGEALADVLFGDYNPGGKLTTTWYKSVSDLPSMNDYDIKNNRTYMYFTGTPLYPFGHGLSYTEFIYSNLNVNAATLNAGGSLTVSADVTNSGAVIGDEIVQFYVHTTSDLKRPVKELKGFNRITLEPGQTKTVVFNIKHEDLQYYDVDSRSFKVENGNVDVYIGSSSQDIRLTGQFSAQNGAISEAYRQNPFSLLQAEHFESKSSTVTLKPGAGGGFSVGFSGTKSYIAFKNVDFTNPSDSIIIQLASKDAGAVMDIVLDKFSGPKVGTLKLAATSDLETYSVQSAKLSKISGIHDVYLNYVGSNTASLARVDWFNFEQSKEIFLSSDNENSEFQCSLFPNPSGAEASLAYHLPKSCNVDIEIFTIKGDYIKAFHFDNQSAGAHELDLKSGGNAFKRGIYVVRFKSETYNKSLVMVSE